MNRELLTDKTTVNDLLEFRNKMREIVLSENGVRLDLTGMGNWIVLKRNEYNEWKEICSSVQAVQALHIYKENLR